MLLGQSKIRFNIYPPPPTKKGVVDRTSRTLLMWHLILKVAKQIVRIKYVYAAQIQNGSLKVYGQRGKKLQPTVCFPRGCKLCFSGTRILKWGYKFDGFCRKTQLVNTHPVYICWTNQVYYKTYQIAPHFNSSFIFMSFKALVLLTQNLQLLAVWSWKL